TALHVRLDHSLSTKQHQSGEGFTATVTQPVRVDGKVVIPEGSQVNGVVVHSKESGRLSGRAQMGLALESVQVGGENYDIATNTITRASGGHKKRNIALIGGGGAGGAIIGAIAAGGKGALIGGPIGAGAGLGVAALTGKKNVRVPAETMMTFRLAEPVSIEPIKPKG
ncbi:MAG: hypothetical protein ACRD2Q_11945, partial [Terriglobales bacterium]